MSQKTMAFLAMRKQWIVHVHEHNWRAQAESRYFKFTLFGSLSLAADKMLRYSNTTTWKKFTTLFELLHLKLSFRMQICCFYEVGQHINFKNVFIKRILLKTFSSVLTVLRTFFSATSHNFYCQLRNCLHRITSNKSIRWNTPSDSRKSCSVK